METPRIFIRSIVSEALRESLAQPPLDSMPANTRPRLPVAKPAPNLSTTRNAAAAVEASAVRL